MTVLHGGRLVKDEYSWVKCMHRKTTLVINKSIIIVLITSSSSSSSSSSRGSVVTSSASLDWTEARARRAIIDASIASSSMMALWRRQRVQQAQAEAANYHNVVCEWVWSYRNNVGYNPHTRACRAAPNLHPINVMLYWRCLSRHPTALSNCLSGSGHMLHPMTHKHSRPVPFDGYCHLPLNHSPIGHLVLVSAA